MHGGGAVTTGLIVGVCVGHADGGGAIGLELSGGGGTAGSTVEVMVSTGKSIVKYAVVARDCTMTVALVRLAQGAVDG